MPLRGRFGRRPDLAGRIPAHLPGEVTARLNKAFVDAIGSSELKARLAGLFAEPMASSPDRFAAFVKSELGKYEKVVKASGARIE